jgi:hypothetical protein
MAKSWRLIETVKSYGETRHRITANSKAITDWLKQQPSRCVQRELKNRIWHIDEQLLTFMFIKWG